jgi:GDPmannose 4,6-dehydratase
MKKAIITGITGQDGAYLAQLLLARATRSTAPTAAPAPSISGASRNWASRTTRTCTWWNTTSPTSAVRSSLVQKSEPDEIYNLAAQSFVGVSFDQPATTAQITGIGALHLLEAIRLVNPKIRFYQASTSEMFGKVQAIPQKEDTPSIRAAPTAWPSCTRTG